MCAGTLSSLINFHGFSNFLQVNAGIILILGHDHFLLNSLPLVICLSSAIFKSAIYLRSPVSEISSLVE
jgi:hypothetical protein